MARVITAPRLPDGRFSTRLSTGSVGCRAAKLRTGVGQKGRKLHASAGDCRRNGTLFRPWTRAVAALQAAAKGRCIGPTYPVELPLAQQFSNRPDHREFLRTALVLLGVAAQRQSELGTLSGTARPAVLAHPHAGIALHTSLPTAL